jgi:ribosomal RNA-processing protein 12
LLLASGADCYADEEKLCLFVVEIQTECCDADSSKLSLPLRLLGIVSLLTFHRASDFVPGLGGLILNPNPSQLLSSCREFTEIVGPRFQERENIRLFVSQAIQKICAETRKILVRAGDDTSHADPCTTNHLEFDQDDIDDDRFDDQMFMEKFSLEDGQKRATALKAKSKFWLPTMLNAFIATPAFRRNHIQTAISGYCCICEGAVTGAVFKSAMMRLVQVSNQLRTGELGRDAVMDGGDSDIERYCSFVEALYAMLGGINVDALDVVYQLVASDMNEKDPAVQKKAYKILHHLIEHRPDFYTANFEGIVEQLLQGSDRAISASRGFRIKCLKSVILHLLSDQQNMDLSKIPSIGVENQDSYSAIEKAKVLITPMIAEIVLSIKESNKKTRAAAFHLLIEVAGTMDDNDPENGIVTISHLVLGGLVGSTSQMVSASVTALARILYEFTPKVIPMIHDLLSTVLILLHSKSREVISSVLGFLKIVIMRLDSGALIQYVPEILEGVLVWAEDSKNKFRLKVRVILERLAKKVGFETLQRYFPDSHRPLLSHVRKDMKRKDRLKVGRSELDWDEQSFANTVNSMGSLSKAASKDRSVLESELLSQYSTGKSTRITHRSNVKAQARQNAGLGESGGIDPLNLLDSSTTRQMVGLNVRRSGHIERERLAEEGVTFQKDDHGRLIIEEPTDKKRGRERSFMDDYDSDDSDEDLRSIGGAELALKGAQSLAKIASYAGTVKRVQDSKRIKKNNRGSNLSGERYKSKRTGVGGDVKGKNKLEPFAYWQLDRSLMNRRQHKSKRAKQELKNLVSKR